MKFFKQLFCNNAFFVIFVSLILILLTEAVFVYGHWINDHDHYYTGLHILTTIDGPVYFSYIEQVKAGHFLFKDLFNSNDNFRVFNPFWLAVGLIAKILKISAPVAIEIFRIILIPIFLFVLFKIINLFLSASDFKKKVCYLYSLILSGLGYIFFPFILLQNLTPDFKKNPLDLWAYEANNFMTLRYYPHAIASTFLILLIFYFFYQAIEEKGYKKSILAGVLALFLFSFHPFHVPLIYVIPLVYILVLFFLEKKFNFNWLKKYLLLVLMSLPSVIYYFYLLIFNKNILLKALQNDCLMPSPFLFVISFSPAIFLAFYYIFLIIKKKQYSHANIFLIVWFLTNIILVYGPYNIQRRLLEGFIVPLSILSFYTLNLIAKKLRETGIFFKIVLIISAAFFLSLSNLFIYTQEFKFLKKALAGEGRHAHMVYVSDQIKEGLDWYEKKADEQDIILSSYKIGNIIPALTGKKVYLGHPIETVGFMAKKKAMENFFASDYFDREERVFLRENKITYIFYSDFEKKIGDFEPGQKDYLENVFNNQSVIIYKIKSD